MSAIIRLSLELLILCIVAVAFIVSLGHTAHAFAQLLLISIDTNPDGSLCNQPCMFGVQPGITPVAQSYTILESHPFLRAWQIPPQSTPIRYTRHIPLEGMQLTVYSFDGQVVSYVELLLDTSDPDHFLRYGSIIAEYGPPVSTCVDVTVPGKAGPVPVVLRDWHTLIYPEQAWMAAKVAQIDRAQSHPASRGCVWRGFND